MLVILSWWYQLESRLLHTYSVFIMLPESYATVYKNIYENIYTNIPIACETHIDRRMFPYKDFYLST